MKIGFDLMGGDFAPEETLKAIKEWLSKGNNGYTLVVYGTKEVIANIPDDASIEKVITTQIVDMGDSPTKAIQTKPDSSIVKGISDLAEGKIDAYVSAGNTGAVYVAGVQIVGRIEGVQRPALISYLPRWDKHPGILIDVGANADVRPEHLLEFARLGSVYVNVILEVDNPKVGLLNIGEEESKGNQLVQGAYKLLKEAQDINFVGNIEGRYLFSDKADVVVCSGFVGNVLLKSLESLVETLIKECPESGKLKQFLWSEYGGVPILGVKAPIIIGHGISKAPVFLHMIEAARQEVDRDLVGKLTSAFQNVLNSTNGGEY